MSDVQRRYCIFGCDSTAVRGAPYHRFPNPEKRPELFAAWVSAAGDHLRERDPKRIRNKRICDHHFDHSIKTAGGRRFWSAIPTINLHRVKQSISTIVEADHSYSRPRREFAQPLADITNLPRPSSAIKTTTFPVPSGSSAMTCLTVAENNSPQIKGIRFDADQTFQYLLNKKEKLHTKKTRQNRNEIRRLRRKVKNYHVGALRLRQQQRLSTKRDFQKLTQKMSEAAKMFTRMQVYEGPKKKHGRRFTQDEKILSLTIFKKKPQSLQINV